MHRKTLLAIAATATLASPAQAAMAPAPLSAPSVIERVQLPFPFQDAVGQFLFGGRDYCWYDDGWRGPGWYWCGYGYRDGYGWGGGEGFNGWREHRYERDWHGHHGGGGYGGP